MNDFQHKPKPRCIHKWRVLLVKTGNTYRKDKECLLCPKKVMGALIKKNPVRLRQLTERKAGIKKMSDKKLEWNKKYEASKRSDAEMQRCAISGVLCHKGHMDPHHPKGRVGERILYYFWITPTIHNFIHANGKEARSLGLLQPEFDGRISNSETPNPWFGKEPKKKP